MVREAHAQPRVQSPKVRSKQWCPGLEVMWSVNLRLSVSVPLAWTIWSGFLTARTGDTRTRSTSSGGAYRWDIRPSSWARHACAVAERRLTRSEWADALPERKYAPACPH